MTTCNCRGGPNCCMFLPYRFPMLQNGPYTPPEPETVDALVARLVCERDALRAQLAHIEAPRSQGDAAGDVRGYPEEPLDADDERQWLKDWRSGAFSSTSRDEFGWPIEMHGLSRSVERWIEVAEIADRERTEAIGRVNEVRAAIDMRCAERDAAREALRKYGQHKPHCPAQIAKYVPMGDCTCGFDAATAALDTGAS